MVVRRVLEVLLLLSVSINSIMAQTTLTSKEMIAISPVVCDALELDTYSQKMLNMKLMQIVTANGFGSTSCRYALVPNMVIIDKQVTATAPAMYSVEFELSLYVVDVVEEIIMSETSLILKGLDRIESKAFTSGINNIATRSPQLKLFMDKSRTSILDYYATRTMTLLKKAESLAERELYEEAMEVLSPIPESVDEYPVVADALVAIYKKKLDKDAKVIMQLVHQLTSQEKYDEAFAELSKIDPASNYWNDANAEIDKIIATIEARKKAALEAEKARLEAQIIQAKELTAQKELAQKEQELNMIEKAREVEASQSSMDKFSKRVNDWFLATFKKK